MLSQHRGAPGDSGSAIHICLAGEQCGSTLLPTKSGGQGPPPYAHGVASYFGLYGTGQFDGQNSGHDFLGTVSLVPHAIDGEILRGLVSNATTWAIG